MNHNSTRWPMSGGRSLIPADIALLCFMCMFGGISQAAEKDGQDQKPILVLPVAGTDDRLHFGKEDGGLIMGQSFGYDPERKLAAAATGGLRLRIEGIPVPVTMGFSSGFSGSMSALYENTLWDLTSFPAFSLGGLNSTKGQQLARIFLVKGQLNKLYISKDYVVFPEPSRSVEKDGPFANVTFEWESAKPRVSKGSRLVVTRNGKEIKNCDVDPMKKTNLGLGKVASTNDVVEWIVKDAKGTPTHRSSLAFPVIAAAPGLVEYVVTIPVMDEAKK